MVKAYEPLYTVPEVAKVLKTNRERVYKLINTGELPYILLGSKKIRGMDLERYINGIPQADPEKESCDTG